MPIPEAHKIPCSLIFTAFARPAYRLGKQSPSCNPGGAVLGPGQATLGALGGGGRKNKRLLAFR